MRQDWRCSSRLGGYAAELGMFEPIRGIGRIKEGRGGFCM